MSGYLEGGGLVLTLEWHVVAECSIAEVMACSFDAHLLKQAFVSSVSMQISVRPEVDSVGFTYIVYIWPIRDVTKAAPPLWL